MVFLFGFEKYVKVFEAVHTNYYYTVRAIWIKLKKYSERWILPLKLLHPPYLSQKSFSDKTKK